ncbi:biopolymer transporter ExbD [Paracoccus marinaquae]|uniref:Biopolymer transporter ExbD n=1 Tax=Paracoccus marinaquae TaxID=2841926 RepID=A0ABS6AK36_9RHOB|nr:biopolymer transporter ExbD [Paracoccus marinaquae]MBU3030010.1 biopolymer transporter ExbD [Paracoccus marinaquae]
MRIDMPPRKPRGESIIPMINVVFLLLIFFLLTAQIAPPTPFEVIPPDSRSDIPAQEQGVLYVSAEGELAYDAARDEAVWPLIAAREATIPLEIRADAATPGKQIAGLLKRLREVSESEARLVVSGG